MAMIQSRRSFLTVKKNQTEGSAKIDAPSGENSMVLTFGPPQFLFEINDHVSQTHFWSTFITNESLVRTGPKVSFRSV